MPRSDENGRHLQSVLAYLLDTRIKDIAMATALGVTVKTFNRRRDLDEFPTAEDCRLAADHFGINSIELMIRFGVITVKDVENFMTSSYAASFQRLRKLGRRNDISPV